jgi:SET domain-containing protein
LGPVIRGLVEVRPCQHGRGLFASTDIKKGAVIRRFDAIVLVPVPSPSEGSYALRIGDHEYWDGYSEGSPYYWSNFIDHSDDPNAVFVFDRGKKRAWLKAAKPISNGEEIFISYSRYHSANPTF